MKTISLKFWTMLFLLIRIQRRIGIYITDRYYKAILNIDPSASIGCCYLDKKNISIGRGTYINSGEIFSGEARVTIGDFCAIGKNVSIKARTHDLRQPTGNAEKSTVLKKYADIKLGNYIWVGDNVFIREGVTIGDHAIIAANSVVTKDVPPRAIIGGIPARLIRFNDQLKD